MLLNEGFFVARAIFDPMIGFNEYLRCLVFGVFVKTGIKHEPLRVSRWYLYHLVENLISF